MSTNAQFEGWFGEPWHEGKKADSVKRSGSASLAEVTEVLREVRRLQPYVTLREARRQAAQQRMTRMLAQNRRRRNARAETTNDGDKPRGGL